MVNVVSYNVNGLHDFSKRKKIYHHLREIHKAEIILMQETHCMPQDEKLWQSQWGGKIINSFGETNARGTAMLISKQSNVQLLNCITDPNGRYVIAEVKIQGKEIVIAGVYAPNTDKPQFFKQVFNQIETFQNNNVIFAGDLNLVFDTKLDRAGTSDYNHPKALGCLTNCMEEMGMCDLWRIRNPERQQYTCHRKNSKYFSRIDHFLVADSLVQYISDISIKPSYNSDHSVILVKCDFDENKRGRGFWKLNTKLLHDAEYNQLIESTIESVKFRMSHENPAVKWEMIKMSAAEESIKYAKHKAALRYQALKQLQEDIEWWTARLEINPEGEQDEIEPLLNERKNEYDKLLDEKFKGTLFRSKCNWYEHGERSSKYFFNLEKSRYNFRTMKQIYDPDNNMITDPDKILDLQAAYFAKLYSKDDKIQFDWHKLTYEGIKYPEMERNISLEELTVALNGLNENKTPGPDGLPCEFYTKFWSLLSAPLCEAFQFARNTGLLHISSRRGVISLIPKKDRDSRYINNWRPITLLNTDYKILAKALVNRMQPVLEQLISKHQTGFMPGRKISHNIRKMLDIINYMENSNRPGLLLSLDFFKCFDTLSHESIAAVLKYYGFGPNFISHIMLLYTNMLTCTQNNGHSSKWFSNERGSPQGSPASTAIFLICGQLMSDLLENNPEIRGLQVGNETELLVQFADDTNLFLQFDQHSLGAVMQTLKQVYEYLGLKINYDKTVVYRLGSLRNSNAQLYTQEAITWTNDPVKILGVKICNEKDILDINYEGILQKVKDVLALWSCRGVSLMGKVLLINSLVGSLFVYKMSVLPLIPNQIVMQFNQIVRRFLWNSRKARIALNLLQTDKSTGGLRLVNLYNKDISLKLVWIKEIFNKDSFFSTVFYTQLKVDIGDKVWSCQLSAQDAVKLCRTQFWGDVLKCWSIYNKKSVSTVRDVSEQIIWGNSLIKVNNELIFNAHAWQAGLVCVADLYGNNGPLTYRQLCDKFGDVVSWYEHWQLTDAIPIMWKQMLTKSEPVCITVGRNVALIANLTANAAYSHMITDNTYIRPKKERWEKILNVEIDEEEFCKYFNNIYSCTIATKYRNFQYKLLNHAIVTNRTLFICKILDSDLCTFCQAQIESYTHLFWECAKVKVIWQDLKRIICELLPEADLDFTLRSVLFNEVHFNKSHIVNFVVLVTKQLIYRERCFGNIPRLELVLSQIQQLYDIEERLAIQNQKWNKHVSRWKPLKHNLQFQPTNSYINEYVDKL